MEEWGMSEYAGISLALAEEVVDFSADRLSSEDHEQLKRLLIDYAAVTLCGSVQPWGRTLTEWAGLHGAGGKVLLIGSGKRAGANAAAGDVIAFAVGAADDAAVVESTAGHHHGHHTCPVSAAGSLCHHGGTSEFAHHQNQRIIEQSALLKICDDSIQCAIDSRH